MDKVADVNELAEFTGPLAEADMRTFLASYLKTLMERQQNLKKSLDDGDIKQAHAIAHSVKSNALYIAAKPLSLACEKLELALAEPELVHEQVIALWQEADLAFDAVIAYLKEYIGGHEN